MSRIGKQIITLPDKVEYQQTGGNVTIKGPLGSLVLAIPSLIKVTEAERQLSVAPTKQDVDTKALWGTYASHLANMVVGVTKGYEKKLIIEGVGYRASVASDNSSGGQKIVLSLGFSHPVELIVPTGLKVTVDKGLITISGIDKGLVGQFAANIRSLKKPEPYKGKGIRYDNEVIRRKEGKRVVA